MKYARGPGDTGRFYFEVAVATEPDFVQTECGKLPADVHHQSMTGAMPGTPDHYFDLDRDLWIEFKVGRTKNLDVYELLSARQRAWLRRRWLAGGNAAVVVALQYKRITHVLILESPHAWERSYTEKEVLVLRRPRSTLVPYIIDRITDAATANTRILPPERERSRSGNPDTSEATWASLISVTKSRAKPSSGVKRSSSKRSVAASTGAETPSSTKSATRSTSRTRGRS